MLANSADHHGQSISQGTAHSGTLQRFLLKCETVRLTLEVAYICNNVLCMFKSHLISAHSSVGVEKFTFLRTFLTVKYNIGLLAFQLQEKCLGLRGMSHEGEKITWRGAPFFVPFTRYDYGDQTKANGMDGACSEHVGYKK
jgi:hypothetical protein